MVIFSLIISVIGSLHLLIVLLQSVRQPAWAQKFSNESHFLHPVQSIQSTWPASFIFWASGVTTCSHNNISGAWSLSLKPRQSTPSTMSVLWTDEFKSPIDKVGLKGLPLFEFYLKAVLGEEEDPSLWLPAHHPQEPLQMKITPYSMAV